MGALRLNIPLIYPRTMNKITVALLVALLSDVERGWKAHIGMYFWTSCIEHHSSLTSLYAAEPVVHINVHTGCPDASVWAPGV